MRLQELIEGIYPQPLSSQFQDKDIKTVSCDSREELKDGLFIAIPGFKYDGKDFIKDAVAQGACVIVKKIGVDVAIDGHVCVLDVEDPKKFLRMVGKRFYGDPAKKVKVIGVTGTNGKTTITYLLESMIHEAQKSCGVIGTINYRIGNEVLPSKNTTPGFLDNQKYLAQLAQRGIDYCVMETSSHALHQERVDAHDFVVGIFTNLTQDHLDYHKDMDSYFQAKSLLFKNLPETATAVINVDDDYGKRLVPLCKSKVITYAIDQGADVHAANVEYRLTGTSFEIVYPEGWTKIHTRFIGRHNVYNILSAFAAAYAQGLPVWMIRHGIENLTFVPGRLEPVDCGQNFSVYIDYAHTEDGLVNVLNALRAVSTENIILVFGCGGDRDRTKRPKMGQVGGVLADYVIVTSDNPRSEDPLSIIREVVDGFVKVNYEICVDRKEAIGKALSYAQKEDIVLIAGKGHEDYQIFKDQVISFNERQIVEGFLKS